MAVADLQRRQTEVGRIRLGQKVQTKSGKTAPARLETFRFTSPSKQLIERVAALYGGDVAAWQPPRGAQEWEVVTTVSSVPVVVPPQDVESSQFYELWSAGGCQRRCTGQRELISDQPCVCDPDPESRECKLHTRINVMLRDVPGIGVWRLDTGGYYAAVELPGMVELLSRAQGLVPALLELRQRTVTREGKTKHFVVPVLHVEDFTPGELVSGRVQGLALGGGAQRQAIAAAPAGNGSDGPVITVEGLRAALKLARSPETVRRLWEQAKHAGIEDPALKAEMKARGEELARAEQGTTPPAAPPSAPTEPAVEGEVEPDADAVWMQVMAAAGERGWNTATLEERVIAFLDKSSIDANGFELRQFLEALKAGEVQ
jgi:hypothetical protein